MSHASLVSPVSSDHALWSFAVLVGPASTGLHPVAGAGPHGGRYDARQLSMSELPLHSAVPHSEGESHRVRRVTTHKTEYNNQQGVPTGLSTPPAHGLEILLTSANQGCPVVHSWPYRHTQMLEMDKNSACGTEHYIYMQLTGDHYRIGQNSVSHIFRKKCGDFDEI